MFFKLFVYIFVKCFITILSAVLLHFDKLFFLLFIIFFAIGSLEELDQELGLDDNNHGNAAKVKDLVEKLKSQTEKDRRKRQQRIEKKGKAYRTKKNFYFLFDEQKVIVKTLIKISLLTTVLKFENCFGGINWHGIKII